MSPERRKGGFPREQTFLRPEKIDKLCLEALSMAGFLPQRPEPIRIDRFIEKYFKVHLIFPEMDASTMGYTKFGQSGPVEVAISMALVEEATTISERRVRSTISHEAGHCLLHDKFFSPDLAASQESLEDVDIPNRQILCRHVGTTKGPWWEIQANKCIGGFLLPKPLVDKAMENLTVASGVLGARRLEERRRIDAKNLLAEVFDVSLQVAEFRLQELFTEAEDPQLSL